MVRTLPHGLLQLLHYSVEPKNSVCSPSLQQSHGEEHRLCVVLLEDRAIQA